MVLAESPYLLQLPHCIPQCSGESADYHEWLWRGRKGYWGEVIAQWNSTCFAHRRSYEHKIPGRSDQNRSIKSSILLHNGHPDALRSHTRCHKGSSVYQLLSPHFSNWYSEKYHLWTWSFQPAIIVTNFRFNS